MMAESHQRQGQGRQGRTKGYTGGPGGGDTYANADADQLVRFIGEDGAEYNKAEYDELFARYMDLEREGLRRADGFV